MKISLKHCSSAIKIAMSVIWIALLSFCLSANTISPAYASGSAPVLVPSIQNEFSVYARTGQTYMFGMAGTDGTDTSYDEHGNTSTPNRLEDFFTDTENDTLDFWVTQDGLNFTQGGITTLVDVNGKRYSSFVFSTNTAGSYEFYIFAHDGTSFSDDCLTINLSVSEANSGNIITTEFQTASDITNFVVKDSSGNPVTATSVSGTTYTFTLAKGTYSFSGEKSGWDQPSGMRVTIPTSPNVDGSDANPDTVFVKEVDVAVKAGSDTLKANQYDLRVIPPDTNDVVLGVPVGTNGSSTKSSVPALVHAKGNAALYTFFAKPIDSSLSGYSYSYAGNVTYSANTTAVTRTISLPTAVTHTITAPAGSTVKVFNQIRNYQTEVIEPDSVSGNTYTYKLPKSSGTHYYRVSQSGYITKGGYLSLSADGSTTVTLSSGSATQQATSTSYDPDTTIGSRGEDSVLLGMVDPDRVDMYTSADEVNAHNFRELKGGQTFRLRAYRAAWQVINSDTANIMIEPDFRYQFVQGSGLVTVTPVADHPGWFDVTANTNTSGVAIIKVTSDALDVENMSYSNSSSHRFYATADGREGYAVIEVENDDTTAPNSVGDVTLPKVDLAVSDHGTRTAGWDSEIDTVYYTGSSGSFTFTPAAYSDIAKSNPITVSSVEKRNSDGSWSTVTPSNGAYTITVTQGLNMVRVNTASGVVYAPIRAKQVTVKVNGSALTSGTTVAANSTNTITFDGLCIPVPKFSGIYNPMNNKINYTVSPSLSSSNFKCNARQYDFITKHALTFIPTSSGTYSFTNGYHSMSMFCNTTQKWGHHRILTDAGVSANFSAGLVSGVFNIYPDFQIQVTASKGGGSNLKAAAIG